MKDTKEQTSDLQRDFNQTNLPNQNHNIKNLNLDTV